MKTKKVIPKKLIKKQKTIKLTKNDNIKCFPSDWFDKMPAPIFILDESGQILYANDAFCDLINKKKKACLAVKPMDMMIDQAENRKFLKDLLQVYRGVAIKRGIYTLNISGKSFKTLLDIAPVYDNKKKMVQYAVGLILDHDSKKGLRRLRDLFK
ncbi:MAG: PAS domain-containing protein [Patescibacteria group bacterium]|nr:PAS domain-containing protein [Patescibacteria group bacterium]